VNILLENSSAFHHSTPVPKTGHTSFI